MKFKKLIVGNRFDNTFENWITNNEITFSDNGFADIYAANGVGKSSFAKALKNELKAQYEYEYNGKTYTEGSSDTPVSIIDDFFFRNIATREDEKISDYILGTEINKELDLKEKIKKSIDKIKEEIITYLKDEHGIKTKNSNFYELANNDNLKVFINAIANNRDKAKDYNEEKLLELLIKLKTGEEITYNDTKYNYIRENLEKKESVIKSIIEFDTDNINLIEGFRKLDINNDAIKILNKHKNMTICMFDDSHVLSQDVKERLEENKKSIISKLNPQQKALIDRVLELGDEPFGIKEIFNFAFETGEISKINELITEIKLAVLKIENSMMKQIIKIITDNKLLELYNEYKELIDKKVTLTNDDEILLKEIIENCINKKVNIGRDNNKNIIFTIENNNFIGKSRRELPLSTGEQNFISLYFELLAAKNNAKDIIIIDDPISSFDSIYKNKIIYSIIKVLQNKKVIILTHNIGTIQLMQHQYKDCFNLYILNNEEDGNNGFIKIEKKLRNENIPKDMDLILEIKNVIEIFKCTNFVPYIKNKEQFLLSTVPFMRSYVNLLNTNGNDYKELSKLMHGYESEKIDVNKKYKDIFNLDVLGKEYKVNIEDILLINIDNEIVDIAHYPLLNRTLFHTLNYLKLRLLVENTLYNTDKSKIDINRNPQLHNIIEKYLQNDNKKKSKLLSKKTLLNEFNHFEFDMCLFMPSLDISDTKLKEEKDSIEKICEEIKTNGI